MPHLTKLSIGWQVPDCLAGDRRMEMEAHSLYVQAIGYCEEIKDYVTRETLDTNLHDIEEQIDYLETQIGLIEQVGLENFLQSSMGDISS